MEEGNCCTVTEFVLLGLTESLKLQLLLSVIFLAVYGATVLGNLLIVALEACEPRLHTPMYMLLGKLSFLDFCYSSITAPNFLAGFLLQAQTISYGGGMAQIFFFHFIRGIKIFLLTIMAYDRYVAIFHPPRYVAIMNQALCVGLVGASWVDGFIHSIIQVSIIIQLSFCGPHELDNFYCDVPQVVKLACADTFAVELLMVSNSGLMTLLGFMVLLISYSVLLAKLSTHSCERRAKALFTCASHLTMMTLIFGPCIYIYARPFCSFPMDKTISVLYTVVTPVLNPVIYTLRKKEVQLAVRKLRK
ncbi:olfactory receptor 4D5-like [Macrochelys suwanniensis]